MRALSHTIAFDDFPFARAHRGDVPVVGVVFAGLRLEGVVSGRIRRDGANATRVLAALTSATKFAPQLQLILLQGIALGGFNVVDLHALHEATRLPVLVVARRAPRLEKMRAALLGRVRGGTRKWAMVERLPPMEPVANVWVQRAGLDPYEARAVVRRLAVHSRIPEPLRAAHLIAGGIATGQSRGRP